LPDGKHISINTCRFRAPEILFQPHLIGEEVDGIHQTLLTAIQKSDLDLRSDLYSNIVLSGGTTLFEGFGDRLLREVKDQVQGQDVKIRISAPQERIFSTWIGGSILASLDTFRRMWITKADYENEGAKRMYLKNMM
jgi:centractin